MSLESQLRYKNILEKLLVGLSLSEARIIFITTGLGDYQAMASLEMDSH